MAADWQSTEPAKKKFVGYHQTEQPVSAIQGQNEASQIKSQVKALVSHKTIEAELKDAESLAADNYRALKESVAQEVNESATNEPREQLVAKAKDLFKQRKWDNTVRIRKAKATLESAKSHGADTMPGETTATDGTVPSKKQPLPDTDTPVLSALSRGGKMAMRGIENVLSAVGRGLQGAGSGFVEDGKDQRSPYTMAELEEAEKSQAGLADRQQAMQSSRESTGLMGKLFNTASRTGSNPENLLQQEQFRVSGQKDKPVDLKEIAKTAGAAVVQGEGTKHQLSAELKELQRFYKQNAINLAYEKLGRGADREKVKEEAKRIYGVFEKAEGLSQSLRHPDAAQNTLEWAGNLSSLGNMTTLPVSLAARGVVKTAKLAEKLPVVGESVETFNKVVSSPVTKLRRVFSRDPHLVGLKEQGDAPAQLARGLEASADAGMVFKEQAQEAARGAMRVFGQIPRKERDVFAKVMDGQLAVNSLSPKSQRVYQEAQKANEEWWNLIKDTMRDVRDGKIVQTEKVENFLPRKLLDPKTIPGLDKKVQEYGYGTAKELLEDMRSEIDVSRIPGDVRKEVNTVLGTLGQQQRVSGSARITAKTGSEKARTDAELPWLMDTEKQFEQYFNKQISASSRAFETKEIAARLADQGVMVRINTGSVKQAGKALKESKRLERKTEGYLGKLTEAKNSTTAKIDDLQKELDEMPGLHPGIKSAVQAELREGSRLSVAQKKAEELLSLAENARGTGEFDTLARRAEVAVDRYYKQTDKTLQSIMRSKDIQRVMKQRPGLEAKLSQLQKKDRGLSRKLTKTSDTAERAAQSSRFYKTQLETAVTSSKQQMSEVAKVSQKTGMDMVELKPAVASEVRRLTSPLGSAAQQERIFVPKAAADQFDVLFPTVNNAEFADKVLGKSLAELNDLLLVPPMSMWRSSKTLLGGGVRYVSMQYFGNAANTSVALGLKMANPGLNMKSFRITMAKMVHKDPLTLSTKMKLANGESTTLGWVMQQMQKYGVIGQGGLKIGQEMGTGRGPLGYLAKASNVLAYPARKLTEGADDFNHVVNFMSSLKGTSLDDVAKAVEFTTEMAGNYRRLSKIERTFLKQVFPFYAWNKFYYPFFAKRLMDSPRALEVWRHTIATAEESWGRQFPTTHLAESNYAEMKGVTAPPFAQPTDEQRERFNIPDGAYNKLMLDTSLAIFADFSEPGFMNQTGPYAVAAARLFLGYDPIKKEKLPENMTWIPDLRGAFDSGKSRVANIRDELKRTRIGNFLYGYIDKPTDTAIDIYELYFNDGQYGAAIDWARRISIGNTIGGADWAVCAALKKFGIDVDIQTLGFPGMTILGVDPQREKAKEARLAEDQMQNFKER